MDWPANWQHRIHPHTAAAKREGRAIPAQGLGSGIQRNLVMSSEHRTESADSTAKKKILLVDDDAEIIDSLRADRKSVV